MQRDLLKARAATVVGSNSQANDGSGSVKTYLWVCVFGWQFETSARSRPTRIAAQSLHLLCLVRFQASTGVFLGIFDSKLTLPKPQRRHRNTAKPTFKGGRLQAPSL